MAWTPEQKKTIELTGTNIIVSAGAGSGKTAVLTTRVLEKLKNGTHINELLILTFTNAAAAEMKQRIKANIEKNNLLTELDLLDTSYITTFDSFALSIVKKYHYLLNISNKINITDSSLIALQKRKILDDIFEKNYQNPSINFQNLINSLCIKDDNNLKEEILRIANKLSIKTDLNTYLDNYLVEYYNETTINKLINDYQSILNKSVNELFLELENYQMDFETDYYTKLQETFSPLKSNDLDTLIATIKALKLPSLKRGSDEISKFAKEKINKKLKELKSITIYGYKENIINDYKDTKSLIEPLLSILKDFFNNLTTYKKNNEIYDFTDIAKLSLEILKNNKSIRLELKNYFKEIMVDEYQDTSDIQEEFISLISNNNVYMVGDIKQSIYRFRNANPYIFKNKYDNYSKNLGGAKIDLVKNFRSRPEVLENINTIFNPIMDDLIGNADYRESHQMVFGNTTYINEGKTDYNNDMTIYKYNVDNSDFSKEEIEFFKIAQDIKEKMINHYQILDKETSTLRNIEYKDFCIILDRNSSFDLAKKIFEYFDLPLSLYKDEEINQSNDIYLIKNLLILVTHLKEKNLNNEFSYAFTSVARSFLYEYSDEELLKIIKNKKECQTPIIKSLYQLVKNMNILSTQEIIAEIIKITNYYEALIKVGNMNESIIRLNKIMELADNTNYNIYEFIDYLNDLLTKSELIKYNVKTTTKSSIKIMNIHKSKGLEFPICYFAGLYKAFSKQDLKGDIIYEPNMPLYIPTFNEGIKENIVKLIIKEKMKTLDISEKIRLFYVALTRAKEKMIMFLPITDDLDERKNADGLVINTIRYNYSSFADFLNSIPKELEKYTKTLDIKELDLTKDYLLLKDKNLLNEEKKSLIINELEFKENNITNKTFSKKTKDLIDNETRKNMEFGTIVHEILEHIDFKNLDLSLIENNFIKNIINSLVKTPLFKDIGNATIFKEYEFIDYDLDIEYHGKIDLMIVHDEYIDIVDYKLNDLTDENYINQLNGYKTYISKNTTKQVNIYLFSLLTSTLKKLN